MLGIILLGLAIAAVLLVMNQGRSHGDVAQRVEQIEAQNLQLHERVQVLEALIVEKEKQRGLMSSSRRCGLGFVIVCYRYWLT